jgi:hypothetical protein
LPAPEHNARMRVRERARQDSRKIYAKSLSMILLGVTGAVKHNRA